MMSACRLGLFFKPRNIPFRKPSPQTISSFANMAFQIGVNLGFAHYYVTQDKSKKEGTREPDYAFNALPAMRK